MAVRYVGIVLDKARRIRYDVNAMSDLETVLGMGIGAIFAEDQIGFRVIRALLWAGLKWEDRGLTLDRAGTLMNEFMENSGSLQELASRLMEAVKEAGWLGPKAEGEESEGNGMGA